NFSWLPNLVAEAVLHPYDQPVRRARSIASLALAVISVSFLATSAQSGTAASTRLRSDAAAIRRQILMIQYTYLPATPGIRLVAITPRPGGAIETVAFFPTPSVLGPFGFRGSSAPGALPPLALDTGSPLGDANSEASIVLRQLFNRNYTRLALSWTTSDQAQH